MIEEDVKKIQDRKKQLKEDHIVNINKIKHEHHNETKDLQDEFRKEEEKTLHLIKSNQAIIEEHKVNSLNKHELIQKEEHLRNKLKFEKNYIESERLKFCEEKLTQERELGDYTKENFTLEANINNIKGNIRTESRNYHNSFIKKQNGLTDIISNLEKLESKKRSLNLDKHLYDLEDEFVDKMIKKENNKTQKNTNALRELQSQINEKQIAFNKSKEKYQEDLQHINKENDLKVSVMLEKKEKVLKELCNTEFIGRCIWFQRQRLSDFFVQANKHYEQNIRSEKANLGKRELEYNEKQERNERLASLEEEYDYLKYFKEKVRL